MGQGAAGLKVRITLGRSTALTVTRTSSTLACHYYYYGCTNTATTTTATTDASCSDTAVTDALMGQYYEQNNMMMESEVRRGVRVRDALTGRGALRAERARWGEGRSWLGLGGGRAA